MNGDKVLFSSKCMTWRTPQDLYDRLDAEFHFVLDAAASDNNHLCDKWFTVEDDGLAQSWDAGGAVFVNPPYGRSVGKWVRKASEESRRINHPIVMLIPARTDTAWFHEWIYHKAQIRFLRGRLHFRCEDGKDGGSAPFPSMIVIFEAYKEER